jgi:uncharacterized protein with FMN-binding domain
VRRALAATLTVVALALPYAGAAAAATKPKPVKKVTTKSYVGPAGTAGRWGTVQVTIVVKTTTTTTGKKKTTTQKITDVKSAYEVHTDRSQFIMEQALPLLKQEVLQAQSADVQLISHATDTSEAFLESLQEATSKLHLT